MSEHQPMHQSPDGSLNPDSFRSTPEETDQQQSEPSSAEVFIKRRFVGVLKEVRQAREAYPNNPEDALKDLHAYAREFQVPIIDDAYELFDAVEMNIQDRINNL